MAGSTLSRRVSEFVGVALFAAAADLDHLARQLRADRPRLVLQHRRRPLPPANFAGRVGAFLAELSFQLLGYASYLIPAVLVVARLALLLVPGARRGLHEARRAPRCSSRASARSSRLAFGTRRGRRASRSAPAATSASWLAGVLGRVPEPHRLDRSCILTLLFLAVILSTQFSFGRFFAVAFAALLARIAAGASPRVREWREERRARAGSARGASRKHTKKSRRGRPRRSRPSDARCSSGKARAARPSRADARRQNRPRR